MYNNFKIQHSNDQRQKTIYKFDKNLLHQNNFQWNDSLKVANFKPELWFDESIKLLN